MQMKKMRAAEKCKQFFKIIAFMVITGRDFFRHVLFEHR